MSIWFLIVFEWVLLVGIVLCSEWALNRRLGRRYHSATSHREGESGVSSNKSSASTRLLIWYAISVLGALLAAILIQLSTKETALKSSTWGLAVFMFVWVVGALIWGEINPRAAGEPDLSDLLRNAAAVVITVDGVVLGLIYTFTSASNHPATLTGKVGALALVVGLMLGLLLYSLVAGKITTLRSIAVATGLYSLTAWALAYGLLCVAFTLVVPSSQ
jgi:hypothetical protein